MAPDKNQDYKEEVLARFFYRGESGEGPPTARAVMVDMEPKVNISPSLSGYVSTKTVHNTVSSFCLISWVHC